jgi:hypothetical protein
MDWFDICHTNYTSGDGCAKKHIMVIDCICNFRWWPVPKHRSPENVLHRERSPVMTQIAYEIHAVEIRLRN